MNQSSNLSVSEGVTYCNNLVLGNYADWRLPTQNELETTLDSSEFNPAVITGLRNISHNDSHDGYWTSTTTAYSIWVSYYNSGSTNEDNFATNPRHIMCARTY